MLFLLVSAVLGGLVIGALGRLVVPGRNPLGCLGTVGVGLAGSLIGGALARALYHDPSRHAFLTLVLEVGAAAAIVALVTRTRRRY